MPIKVANNTQKYASHDTEIFTQHALAHLLIGYNLSFCILKQQRHWSDFNTFADFCPSQDLDGLIVLNLLFAS
jgi:hypothetical protein